MHTSTTTGQSSFETLRRELRGPLCLPGDPGYEQARTIWNAMIDKRPSAVIRATCTDDVKVAVKAARQQGGPLTIRGGGHNIAGDAVCDGGLMLDLSLMRSVRVDPAARTARVEPGATLADLDRETQPFGLATPLGINSTTGVAGLTLGGGMGWVSRKLGLTVDNLLSADVVLASGELVQTDAERNADLFWAIRGGGGNFGVVTSFEFRLHPLGPEVLAGVVVHPASDARKILHEYREVARSAPDDLACWTVMRKAPPLPFLPPDVHGHEVLILAMCHAGDREAGMRAVAPLRALGHPIADVVGPAPFAAWQQTFDPLLGPGRRNYWKSHSFIELSDGAIDVALAYLEKLPSPECELFIAQLGGAINRVPTDATAYPHRNINYMMNVHGRWADASQDRACIGWARDLFNDMAPHATGSVYVNFMTGDEGGRVSQAYASNYQRLARLKARYDPSNLFRRNRNIAPT
jgi:FAD/FMN-containing dehydrogenase